MQQKIHRRLRILYAGGQGIYIDHYERIEDQRALIRPQYRWLEPLPKGGVLNPSQPGDPNVVCHYGRNTSPHAFVCRDCRREFYLQCIEVKTPTTGQIIVCPNCGGENLERLPPA